MAPRASLRAQTVLSIFAVALVLWCFIGRAGGLGPREMLVASEPTIEGFLTHQLYHRSGLHLLIDLAVILLAGALLESYWGTLRFLLFTAFVGCGVALTDLVAGQLVLAFLGPYGPAPATFGLSGLAFACLVLVAVAFPARRLLRTVGVSHLVWGLILCGGAGLAWLDRASAASSEAGAASRLFLLPQLAGVGWGIAWAWLLPRAERWGAEARQRSQERHRRRVRELRRRVDGLLERISSDGMESLSRGEKSFLREASRFFKPEE